MDHLVVLLQEFHGNEIEVLVITPEHLVGDTIAILERIEDDARERVGFGILLRFPPIPHVTDHISDLHGPLQEHVQFGIRDLVRFDGEPRETSGGPIHPHLEPLDDLTIRCDHEPTGTPLIAPPPPEIDRLCQREIDPELTLQHALDARNITLRVVGTLGVGLE